MTTTKTPEEVLGMSDEEFSKLNAPPEVTPAQEETPEAAAARLEAEEAQRLAEEAAKANPAVEPLGSTELEPVVENDKLSPSQDGKELPSPTVDAPVEKPEAKAPVEKQTPPDYEVLYKQLMAPIKANGKTIELKSPEELVQLAQMGANYTKKMQAIQPHRKVLLMLENNGLLDEDKLSYLIDLNKKDPEAIKKLVKDAGINPLDIDTEVESTYQQGNHRVSDEEAAFVTNLEDLKSTPEGTQTIQTMNTWDQASKEVLWKNPQLMTTIHSQRTNGIYDTIAKEIDRRRTLGNLPTEVPFLHAYKQVGDELHAAGAFNNLAKQPQSRTPVATRVAAPKPAVTNGDKASAAAPSRSSPKVTKPFINPLAMSDEEFMKEFKHRL